MARPADHNPTFSAWSLPKLADFLVAEGVVDKISHEGLRPLLREEGVSFQAVNSWTTSTGPDYEAERNLDLEPYVIAGGKVQPGPVDQSVVIRMDELGPPEPDASPRQAVGSGRGRQGFSTCAPARDPGCDLHTRPNGVRHLMAGYDLSRDKLYGHVTKHKGRVVFLSFRHFSRSPHPKEVRIAIVIDNVSTHRSGMKNSRAGQWAKDNNVELT